MDAATATRVSSAVVRSACRATSAASVAIVRTDSVATVGISSTSIAQSMPSSSDSPTSLGKPTSRAGSPSTPRRAMSIDAATASGISPWARQSARTDGSALRAS